MLYLPECYRSRGARQVVEPRSTCSRKNCVGYVVPADHKWSTRVVVGGAVIDTLASLDLYYPDVDKAKRHELAAARKALLAAKEPGAE